MVLSLLTAAVMIAGALMVPSTTGNHPPTGTATESRDASVVPASEAPGATCSTPLQFANPIDVDQATIPDSLDPAVSYSTPGWGAIQQVYQGLVNYNGSSATSFVGVLAKNWTESYNPLIGFDSYRFSLRSGVHFSNGDPYNAYVQWYSFYRSLLLAQGPQFILEQNFYSTNFSPTNPLSYYSPLSYDAAANATLADYLNSWNFFDPTVSEVAMMEDPLQSFQVVNNLTIQLNLGYGYLQSNYTYLLASISAPTSYAVDPAWIDANGGVVVSTPNSYLATHTIGTGQYVLQNYTAVEGGGYLLAPNPSYWGNSTASTEPWNTLIQPANTSVQVRFQNTADVEISDLLDGAAASASFSYLSLSTIATLEESPCVSVTALPTVFGATTGSYWVYLNQSVFPFNNLSVREAISHAINYTQIIEEAFGGYAQQWVGPVPPAYPYNNNVTANLPYYSYNLPLAKQEIADSPCANDACAGRTINYEYLDIGADWAETAEFLANDLSAIGLTIHPVEISLAELYTEQTVNPTGVCTSATAANGGPFPMGQEFYTSDYVSPDDWTQNDAAASGSANQCMAGYSNSTVDSLIYEAIADSNPSDLTADYAGITSLMYNNYTDLWLAVPTDFEISNVYLHGVIPNPMGSAEASAMLFNTQWAKNPAALQPYPVTFSETGLPASTNWSVQLNGTLHSSTGSTLAFSERNGNYSFTVGSVAGYTAAPANGYVLVRNAGASERISFTAAVPPASSSTLFGLPALAGLALILGIIVVAVAVCVLVVRSRRRHEGPPGAPPTPPPPGT